MKISIIGYGNMAKALCQGLASNPDYHLHVAAPSLSINHPESHLYTYSDNQAVIPHADVLILAVKPAQMAAVLEEIHSFLPSTLLIISVAAGLDLQWFAQHLPPHTPVIRAIPNLAASCKQSATPLLANAKVTSMQHALATDLFQHCGQITWVDNEQDLDIITALSGSGLAYLALFVQSMCDAAITMGLSPDIANIFAIQTLAGTASLANLPHQNLVSLQDKITSKAGTTTAALAIFAQHHLPELVLAAMQAAVQRSQSLRREES